MLKVKCICKYCDFTWFYTGYSDYSLKFEICPMCKDKNIRFQEITSNIDYYQGAPEFKSK